MRKKLIVGLVALNALLAVGLFTTEARAGLVPFALLDCCKEAGTPQGYCCADCCWFVQDCNSDEECREAGPGQLEP